MKKQMKVLYITGYGGFKDNLKIQNIPIPKINENEVLIEIHSASINPHDYKTIQGKFKKMEKLEFPAQVGGDVSGIIVKKGKNVVDFEIGDKVFGVINGSIAEYGKTLATQLVKKPTNISYNEASSLSIIGMTTIQAFEYAKIKSGDKVLIHAGSGGIGSFAIQYAKSKNAFVYTTTSSDNVNWVKALGADVVIDYKKENYLNIVSNLDIVFDTLGEQYSFDAFKVIKNGGRVVSILPSEINREVAKELGLPLFIQFIFSLKPSKIEKLKKQKNAFYKFLFVKTKKVENLREIQKLIEKNKVKAIIDKVFEFENSVSAFQYLSQGIAKGKVIIKIK